jgi:DNA-binding IclR family transcriptional regulator
LCYPKAIYSEKRNYTNDMKSKINAQPNQSLIDGFATLQALATAPEPVGNRELARRLGFEPSRVNRLLKTLAYLALARQTSDRKYCPGPGMHVLSAQSLFASGLIQRALPALEKLRRFGHTVALGVLWRDNVSYLFHAPPGMDSAHALGRVGLYPATSGGIGIALLAEFEDDDLAELYANIEIPHFPRGIESLLETVRQVRRDGFAKVEVGQDPIRHTIAMSVGSPVHSAIGVSGRIANKDVNAIVDALCSAASEIDAPSNNAMPLTSRAPI